MSRKKKTIEVPDKLVEGWEKAEQAIGENADLLSEGLIPWRPVDLPCPLR